MYVIGNWNPIRYFLAFALELGEEAPSALSKNLLFSADAFRCVVVEEKKKKARRKQTRLVICRAKRREAATNSQSLTE